MHSHESANKKKKKKNGCEKAEKSLGMKELVTRSCASKITVISSHFLSYRSQSSSFTSSSSGQKLWASRFTINERKKTKCPKKY